MPGRQFFPKTKRPSALRKQRAVEVSGLFINSDNVRVPAAVYSPALEVFFLKAAGDRHEKPL